MITENKNENGLNNIRVSHPSMVQERTKQDICGKGKEQENAGQGGCRTGGCILHAGLKDAGQEKAEQKDAGQEKAEQKDAGQDGCRTGWVQAVLWIQIH